jgi:hypothetical protein
LSLLLASCGLAGGVLLGRAIVRAVRAAGTSGSSDVSRRGEDGPPREDREGDGKVDLLAGFPCQLGDVILASNGEEAWLAGALVLRERMPMATLFIAPDAGGDRAVFARPLPDASLLWLGPIAPGTLQIGREPPFSLEHERLRFERMRRIPYGVERIGTGAPDLGDEVIVAEYSAATGDRILVITGSAGERAWRGRVLEGGTYDLLPGSPP